MPFIEHVTNELCDTEVFRAECRENEVILLTKVWYGRMRKGRCVEMELGYIGCRNDLLRMADQRCSGKRICEIRIPDAQFENTRPCLKELKNYMEVSYKCIPETVSSDYCRKHNELNVSLSSSSSSQGGYIANIVTADTPSCDGTTHPWVIRVQPGQRINLTLYDFALSAGHQAIRKHHHSSSSSHHRQVQHLQQQQQHHDGGGGIHLDVCREYGLLQDGPADKPSPICGAVERISALHLSTTNLVKIWVTAGAAPRDLKRFVIHYTVVGCPDFLVPAHAWFEKTSEGHGILGCEHSDDSWSLVCRNNSWETSAGNCSLPSQPGMDESYASNPSAAISYDGITIAVISGLSFGVVVIIVVVGVVRCVRHANH